MFSVVGMAFLNSGTSRFRCLWSYAASTSRSITSLSHLDRRRSRSQDPARLPRSPPACNCARDHCDSRSVQRPAHSSPRARIVPVIVRSGKRRPPRQKRSFLPSSKRFQSLTKVSLSRGEFHARSTGLANDSPPAHNRLCAWYHVPTPRNSRPFQLTRFRMRC